MGWICRKSYRNRKGTAMESSHLDQREEDNTWINLRDVSFELDRWMELAPCRTFLFVL
jgi:hypothetical protein